MHVHAVVVGVNQARVLLLDTMAIPANIHAGERPCGLHVWLEICLIM